MAVEPSSILLLVIAVGFTLFILKQVADVFIRLLLLALGLFVLYLVANRLDISYGYILSYIKEIWQQIISYLQNLVSNLS